MPLSFSALTMHSSDPARLAEFYRDAVGLPLSIHRHGTLGAHYEGGLGGVHFAVWQASQAVGGPFVPVFRVASLDAELARLTGRGVEARHKPLDIGEGKRVVTLSDPDGNGFRLIELSLG
jgi:predicted enzyme related to lactoylglutathione lyase